MLTLRGKDIEYAEGHIRMAPIYNPDLRSERSADVLVFTSNLVTRAEYTAWQSLFQALKLSVDYWDVEKYGGISGTPQAAVVDWVGRYHQATLLLLHAKSFLTLFKPRDLLTHFFGPSDSVKSAAPWSESSLILHGVRNLPKSVCVCMWLFSRFFLSPLFFRSAGRWRDEPSD